MLVLVRPCYHEFLKDELFKSRETHDGQWLSFMVRVREILAAEGIEMHTWDMFPLEKADVILSQDLPLRRAELLEAKRQAPRAKFIMQTLETPLDRLHYHEPVNHELFDAVLTYNRHQEDNRRYFHFYIPITPPARPPVDLPFSERRPLVMINSNRLTRILGNRQQGLAGLPAVGALFGGWHVPLRILFSQGSGELYSRRRRFARAAERMDPELLDIFGYGWQGERIGWIHKFVRHRPFACARGLAKGSKFDYLGKYRFSLSYENVAANVGYISEKIFDPFFAGTVPIYLGDEEITEAVPADCFVDARKFAGDREILEFVRDCSEADWLKLRNAGRAFLQSAAFEKFLAPALAERMLMMLRQLTGAVPRNSSHP